LLLIVTDYICLFEKEQAYNDDYSQMMQKFESS